VQDARVYLEEVRRGLAWFGGMVCAAGCAAILDIEPLTQAPDASDGASTNASIADGATGEAGVTDAADAGVTDGGDAGATDALALLPSDAADALEASDGAPVCLAPPKGLIHWYRAENDPSDHVVPGTAASWSGPFDFPYPQGYVGQGFGFEDGIYASVLANFPYTGSFTIDAWAMLGTSSATSNGLFASTDFSIERKGIDYALEFKVNEIPLGTESVGTWTHFAVTFDSNMMRMRAFENGALVATQAGTTSINGLYIGDGLIGPHDTWAGVIDEVHVFDRALADDEIAAIAGARLGLCP
jgi:hypothetical protein